MMKLPRSSGILLHITSLPGISNVGDLGPQAYEFIDFLKASGHHYWQILPLTPTHGRYGHSPYSSFSAFAGNPLLISPELLEKDGFLSPADLSTEVNYSDKVDFKAEEEFKTEILKKAFRSYKKKDLLKKDFLAFCKREAFWLDDYSLFQVLQSRFKTHKWTDWPEEFRDRNAKSLRKIEKDHSEEIEKEKFSQFIFFRQWSELRKYAHQNGIEFIGDIPFYVNHESADCWVNPELFKLDEKKEPKIISGVPPDYFSDDGQLWGSPVFNWKKMKKSDFSWWIDRLRQNLKLFDLVRLDHFRAFSAAWEVKAGEKTAKNGKWNITPGTSFFRRVKKEFPAMPFIAEDLGSLDEPVYRLIEKFNFPGMKVLQFAFGKGIAENPYIPYNYSRNNLVYTGTHDNNTSRGWFKKTDLTVKNQLGNYSGIKVTEKNIHQVLHRMALQSVAEVAIIPMQDILGLGAEAVMNIPGTIKGNWTWRLFSLEPAIIKTGELRELNELFGRTAGELRKE